MLNGLIATATSLLLAAAVPIAASGEFEYTYVDVDYLNVDPDNGRSVDGPRVSGSYALADQIHVVGGFARLTDGPVRLTETHVALGYNMLIANGTDLVARGGLIRNSVRLRNFGSASENALLLQVGLRSMVTPELELTGFVTHADFDDSFTSLDLDGVFQFSPMFGMTLGAGFSSERNLYSIGLRITL
jgi:hypothetical protein